MKKAALSLLVIGMWCQYGWKLLDADIERQGQAWNIGQQGQMLALLILVALLSRSWLMRSVCALLGVYSAMVVGCSAWWLLSPWESIPGEGQCSARLDIPLGFLGMAVGLWILSSLVKNRE